MNDPVHLTAAEALDLLGQTAKDATSAVDRIAAALGGDCTCRGTGLRLGGWMGSTPQRPWPDACPLCTTALTPRERQVLQATYLIDHRPDVVRDVMGITLPEDGEYIIDWKMP